MNKFISALAASGGLLLAGCASYPSSIEVANPKTLPTMQQLMNNPQQYQGQTVVLGGELVSTTNENNATELEILQIPLWNSGKPRAEKDNSSGRFRARLNYFVDPQIYQPGRLVSIRGVFTGIEEGSIGEHQYRFPMIQADGIELWPQEQPQTEVYLQAGWGVWGPSPYLLTPHRSYYYPAPAPTTKSAPPKPAKRTPPQ
ncbi:Slp family lipoprotein [Oceanobacter mangrovi]|uniref:Slp family lipoprotein n=1 Tax=Oceanobacter mangrovi TaxID=2862510 RepID=UPI001C8D4935|nr:Slp family lipoprotein [Oceanobacter mangrovi]